MLYPWREVKNCVSLIIYCVSKTCSFVYSNKHSKQQRENFFHLSWVLSVSFVHASKPLENRLLSTIVWHFPGTINGYWKPLLFWHLVIFNRNEVLYSSLWKRLFSNPKVFIVKSTNKTKRFIWYNVKYIM